MSENPPVDVGDDLVTLLQANSAALGDAVLTRVRAEVGADVRYNDGYVFQHLLVGPRTVTQLADLLGVSQQAASKQVADLVRRDLATKHRSVNDARAWQVELSRRGLRCVESARRARAEIRAECEDVLGRPRCIALLEALRDFEAQKKLGLDPTFDPLKLGIRNADFWVTRMAPERE